MDGSDDKLSPKGKRNSDSGHKIPDAIVDSYDSLSRPVYKNNFIPGLRNDELNVSGLKVVAFAGGIGIQHTPREVYAALIAYLNNSYGDDRSSLGLFRMESSGECKERRKRFSQLRELLKERTIAPIEDGWIGYQISDEADSRVSCKVKAAKVRRVGDGAIAIDTAFLESDRWNSYELETIRLSNEYGRILLWLYENRFL